MEDRIVVAEVEVGDADGAAFVFLGQQIGYVQEVVERETGYRLETEIAFVGDFDPPTTAKPIVLPRPPGLVTAEERAAMRAAEQRGAA